MVKQVTTMTHDTNIPQGYKATALGIIPQEWEVMRLGDIVSITSGESPSLYHLKAEGKYPYVKVCLLYTSDAADEL